MWTRGIRLQFQGDRPHSTDPPQPDGKLLQFPTPYLCRCLKVPEQVVRDEIVLRHARTVEEIREKTQAGTGCLCCIRQIRQLLAALVKSDPPNPSSDPPAR
jgi:bacterioferritin-associated ferredoxin